MPRTLPFLLSLLVLLSSGCEDPIEPSVDAVAAAVTSLEAGCNGVFVPSGERHLVHTRRDLRLMTCLESRGSRSHAVDLTTGETVERGAVERAERAAFEASGRLSPELVRTRRSGLGAGHITVDVWFEVDESDVTDARRAAATRAEFDDLEAERRIIVGEAADPIVAQLAAIPGLVVLSEITEAGIPVPMIRVSLPARQVRRFEGLEGITFVIETVQDPAVGTLESEVYEDYFALMNAGPLRDGTFGPNPAGGEGTLVALYEPGAPDSTLNLAGAFIAGDCDPNTGYGDGVLCACPESPPTRRPHARKMASVIRSNATTFGGVANETRLIFANTGQDTSTTAQGLCNFYDTPDSFIGPLFWAAVVEDLVGETMVVSASWVFQTPHRYAQHSHDILHDYAVSQFEFPLIMTAGANTGAGPNLGYTDIGNLVRNGLVIGAVNTLNGPDLADATIMGSSPWTNPAGAAGVAAPDGWELPHLAAPGRDIPIAGAELNASELAGGASIATAVVSGSIASILEATDDPADPTTFHPLRGHPEAIYAGLMVAATHSAKNSAVWPLDLADGIDDADGAGILNVAGAVQVLAATSHRTGDETQSFPSGHGFFEAERKNSNANSYIDANGVLLTDWTVTAAPGETARVAVFGRADVNCTGALCSTSSNSSYPEFCLELLDDQGAVRGASCNYQQNYQFASATNPSCNDEEYTVRVVFDATSFFGATAFGVAWDTTTAGCFTPSHCPETCGNEVDDNCNGLVDCAEASCNDHSACTYEDCTNGIDDQEYPGNGGYGLVDCYDQACAGNDACDETCDNGVDDDKDGDVDCDDLDCDGNVDCLPEVCDDANVPPVDEDNDNLVNCDDPDCAGNASCLVEDGADCFNGVDDDEDTFIDCADAACADEPGCQEGVGIVGSCRNGRDDDGDGLADCLEPDCSGDPLCASEGGQPGECSNGTDDDNDQHIDCADSDCSDDPDCLEEICHNGLDDDHSGQADCADPACVGAQGEVCGNDRDDDCDGAIDEGCSPATCAELGWTCGQAPDGTNCGPHGGNCPDPSTEVCDTQIGRCTLNASALPQASDLPSGDIQGSFFDAFEGLMGDGSNSVQTGGNWAVLEAHRAAVLRGLVVDGVGVPVSGVRVTVNGEPDVGQTFSRADGQFDLLVNGGGRVVLDFERDGYVPVQRESFPRWETFGNIGTVVLTPRSGVATTHTFEADGATDSSLLIVGETIQDADGVRTPAVYVPDGTSIVAMDGQSTSGSSDMTLRITEFTVGNNGPLAMPGPLPETSMYTYAAEFAFDESEDPRSSVEFNQSVSLYLDNFLGLRPGTIVPLGSYDYEEARWRGEQDGLVLRVAGFTADIPNRAILEVQEVIDLAQDDWRTVTLTRDPGGGLEELGITDAELEIIASRFDSVGDTFWRAQISHFTPLDWNLGGRLLRKPRNKPRPNAPQNDMDSSPNQVCGSIINCQSRTLSERVALQGTPHALVYNSNRVEAYARHNRTYTIDLSDLEPPLDNGQPVSNLIHVRAEILGRVLVDESVPDTVDEFTVEWDGKDAYDRRWPGEAVLEYSAEYESPPVYSTVGIDVSTIEAFGGASGASVGSNSFNQLGIGGGCNPAGNPCCVVASGSARLGVTLTNFGLVPSTRPASAARVRRESETTHVMGGTTTEHLGLGGWGLSGLHQLDTRQGIVHLDDGRTYQPGGRVGASGVLAGELSNLPAEDFTAGRLPLVNLESGLRREALELFHPNTTTVGPDGTVLIGDGYNPNCSSTENGLHDIHAARIWAVLPHGQAHLLLARASGNGGWMPENGNDPTVGLRTELTSALQLPYNDQFLFGDMTYAPDGSLYLVHNRGQGGGSEIVRIRRPLEAITGQGGTHGVSLVVGNSNEATEGGSKPTTHILEDGSQAVAPGLTMWVKSIAVTDDGTLYFIAREPASWTGGDDHGLFRLREDGTVMRMLPHPTAGATRWFVHLARGNNNSLLIVERVVGVGSSDIHVVWRRLADGTMEQVAGGYDFASGAECLDGANPVACPDPEDGGTSLDVRFDVIYDVGESPDGDVYVLGDKAYGRPPGSWNSDGSDGYKTAVWWLGGGALERLPIDDIPPAPNFACGSSGTSQFAGPGRIDIGPSGQILLTQATSHRVLSLTPGATWSADNYRYVVSDDGSQIFYFDVAGNHTSTVDATTRRTLREFSYDSSGRLESATDEEGRTTNFEHLSGAVRVTAPAGSDGTPGDEVNLTLNGDYLTAVEGPGAPGERAEWEFAYATEPDLDGGLLTASTMPRDGGTPGHFYEYELTQFGEVLRPQLSLDEGPHQVRQRIRAPQAERNVDFTPRTRTWCNGGTYITGWSVSSSTTVRRSDGGGREVGYTTHTNTDGTQRTVVVGADASQTSRSEPNADGVSQSFFPGGNLEEHHAPDPHVGGLADYTTYTRLSLDENPNAGNPALELTATSVRTATVDSSSQLSPMEVLSATATSQLNGARTVVENYSADAPHFPVPHCSSAGACSSVTLCAEYDSTTGASRCSRTTLDDDRVVMYEVLDASGANPAMAPYHFLYDSRGNVTFAFQAADHAAEPDGGTGECSGTNPCQQFTYDSFDRVTSSLTVTSPGSGSGTEFAGAGYSNYDDWDSPTGVSVLESNGSGAAQDSSGVPLYLSLQTGIDGALETVTTPGLGVGRDHSFEYDALGRPVRYQPPLTEDITPQQECGQGHTCAVFAPGRELQAVVHPDGSATEFDYWQGSGHVRTAVVPGDGTYTFGYDTFGQNFENEREWSTGYGDPSGNLLNVTRDGTEKMSFAWQAQLPVRANWVEGAVQGAVAYNYNNFLNLQGVKLFDRVDAQVSEWEYVYEDDGALSQVLDGAGAVVLDLQHSPIFGHVDEASIGNVTATHLLDTDAVGSGPHALGANGLGRYVGHEVHLGAAAEPEFATSYTYDLAGRIETITERLDGSGASRVRQYGYDVAGRLITVHDGNNVLVEQYEYDANGNRTAAMNALHTVALGPASGNVGPLGCPDEQGNSHGMAATEDDRLCTYGANSYEYDANGFLHSKTSDSGEVTTYDYDVAGRLHEVVIQGGSSDATITYEHDALGRRVRRTSFADPAGSKRWLYLNSLNPIAQLDANGDVEAVFVYATRSNLPDYIVELQPGTSTVVRTLAVVADHLGSLRRLIDVDPTNPLPVVASMDYDSFGNLEPGSTVPSYPFGFAGGLYDPATNLTRFGARDYDPETGRWTAKDPILFEGRQPNLYAYVGNDPVNRIDPTGRIAWIPILGAVLGGASQAIANYDAYLCGEIDGAAYARTIAWGAGWGLVSTFLPGSGLVAGAAQGAVGSVLMEAVNVSEGAKSEEQSDLAGAALNGMIGGSIANGIGLMGSSIVNPAASGLGQSLRNYGTLGSAGGMMADTILGSW